MNRRYYSMERRSATETKTRERIVRATVALHAQHGARATTYAMIAKRAQVAPQTVYNHFPDDTALIGACTGHVNDRAPSLDAAAILSPPTVPARLKRLAEAVFARHAYMAPWLRWHEAAQIPALKAVVADSHDGLRKLIETTVAPDHEPSADFVDAAFVFLDFPAWQALTRGRSSAEAARVAGQCLVDLLPRLTRSSPRSRRKPA